MNAIKAEWVKLSTTKSLWLTSGLILLFAVFIGWLSGQSYGQANPELGFDLGPLRPGVVVESLRQMVIIVVIIQAAMLFTTENRYGLQRTTYLGTPNRWQVALAKVVLYSVITAVLSFLAWIIAAVLANALAAEGRGFELGSADSVRAMWAFPLAMVLVVVFSQSIAMLLRHTAGAVTLILGWAIALENVVSFLPGIGPKVVDWMPFKRLTYFVTESQPLFSSSTWEVWPSLAYFTAWAVGLFAVGAFVTMKRDA
ncbi:ABC-type transporter, permease component [Corynebacterium renale]|uniref:ABC transporter permease n=1 Tax=Corynebacterium renale TaxID=1724 RepID=UPI000DA40657|nr:ABC transporter permease [Corynebacterium renale]SQG63315.1 ABC-type transporter, permease component [Corynebacterium renale]